MRQSDACRHTDMLQKCGRQASSPADKSALPDFHQKKYDPDTHEAFQNDPRCYVRKLRYCHQKNLYRWLSLYKLPHLPPLPLQRYGLDNIHRLCCSAELAG